jgi:outer membrane lipoprotein LolB
MLAVAALCVTACTGLEQILSDDAGQTVGTDRANVPAPDSGGSGAGPVEDPTLVWRERRALLADADDWTAFGKLALRSQTDAWSATLHWRQTGERYRIRLSGPFGAGALQIEGDSHGVALRTSDDQTLSASTPEELLYQHMGWWVPLSGMRYWILGRTEPDTNSPAEQVTVDQAGRVLSFSQSDWLVSYLDYEDVAGFSMPRKATFESRQVSAKLLISRWQIDVGTTGKTQVATQSQTDHSSAAETALEGDTLAAEDTDEASQASAQAQTDTEERTDVDEPEALSPAVTPTQVWRQRRQALLDLKTWKTFGRVVVRTGETSWSSALYWRQSGDNYSIRFSEPLAAGGVQLTGTGQRAELQGTAGEIDSAKQPEPLIEQHLGIVFPVTNLRYWLLGRVRPGIDVEQVFINKNGHALNFEQDGWRVDYRDYDLSGELAMPRRVEVRGGTTRITVVVSGWHTSGAADSE